MLAKVFVSLLLISAVISYPIQGAEDEDDIPVYTEKVSSAKPTTRIPRFESKKLTAAPKKATESIPPVKRSSYALPEQPQVVHKTSKPARRNLKPIRRIPDHPQNSVVEGVHSKSKPSLRVGYNAPQPSYVPVPAPTYGVEYAPEVVANSYQASPLHVEEPRPRKLVKPSAPEYRIPAGNAPHLRYEAAPQSLPAPSIGYKADYIEEKPQPYIFGYEFQDETGATQSRKEEGDDHGNKKGSYSYRDEHGVYRQVEYIADAHGFRAVVKTNEPGTDNQNPADVQIHSEAAKY